MIGVGAIKRAEMTQCNDLIVELMFREVISDRTLSHSQFLSHPGEKDYI